LGGCKVDPDASPEFSILRNHWKKKGYHSIFSDLENAFKAIRKDVTACHCKPTGRTSAILLQAAPERKMALHKYRHKDTASGEGASGGWRFYAILDKETNILYPIIVYPHKAWQDAHDDEIKKCVDEILSILKQRDLNSIGDIAASAE
jgi:hypothetical protein